MAIYVDDMEAYGFGLRGDKVESCHVFSGYIGLSEVYITANRIGIQKRWLPEKPSCPRYDSIQGATISLLS